MTFYSLGITLNIYLNKIKKYADGEELNPRTFQ